MGAVLSMLAATEGGGESVQAIVATGCRQSALALEGNQGKGCSLSGVVQSNNKRRHVQQVCLELRNQTGAAMESEPSNRSSSNSNNKNKSGKQRAVAAGLFATATSRRAAHAPQPTKSSDDCCSNENAATRVAHWNESATVQSAAVPNKLAIASAAVVGAAASKTVQERSEKRVLQPARIKMPHQRGGQKNKDASAAAAATTPATTVTMKVNKTKTIAHACEQQSITTCSVKTPPIMTRLYPHLEPGMTTGKPNRRTSCEARRRQHYNNKNTSKHFQYKVPLILDTPPPTSPSASSTISSDSNSNLLVAGDVVGSLLNSTANMTLHPQYLFHNNNNNNHFHQTTFQHQHNQLFTANHHQETILFYPNPLARFPEPPPRPWIRQQQVSSPITTSAYVATNDSNKPSSHFIKHQLDHQQPEFSVLSYNVLCDRMVNQEMFPTSPDISLNWFYRRELIMRQLLDMDADIVALQELEMEQYETFFKPELSLYGLYDSIFEPKSRAKTMDSNRRKRVDGCAIFFKTKKFKLVQRHLLEFNQIAMANAQGSEAMLNRVMTKDNIGIAAILEFVEPQDRVKTKRQKAAKVSSDMQEQSQQQQRLLVCNTHIHWDPECCDVKLIQTIMLMNELKCIARHHKLLEQQQQRSLGCLALESESTTSSSSFFYQNDYDEDCDLMPLVLLGDFNSMPNSGVTSYITNGKINSLHKDFKNYKYTSCSNALSIHYTNQQLTQTSLDPTASTATTSSSSSTSRRQSSPAWCFYSSSSSTFSSTSPSSSESVSSDSNLSSDGLISTQTPMNFRTKEELVLNYNHPFRLVSAYGKDTMPYTNYTTNFKAIIDYVFYSDTSLQLLALLGPLDKDWLRENRVRGFPQPHVPSDHLPLFARLRLKPRKDPLLPGQQRRPFAACNVRPSNNYALRASGRSSSQEVRVSSLRNQKSLIKQIRS